MQSCSLKAKMTEHVRLGLIHISNQFRKITMMMEHVLLERPFLSRIPSTLYSLSKKMHPLFSPLRMESRHPLAHRGRLYWATLELSDYRLEAFCLSRKRRLGLK